MAAFDVWIENRTLFPASTMVQVDSDGQEVLVGMFSASFEAAPPGDLLQPAAQQLPIILSDESYGDPATSSLRYEADIAPRKPAAEVLVNGTAYAPSGKPVREMQVGLKIGAVRKTLHVIGDRIYDNGAYSTPHPFRSMPIVYERAYGGTTENGRVEMRNPVGVGFHNARSADPAVKTHAPNITYPGEPYLNPSDHPKPAGFGVVGRGWQPRIRYAGTYDRAWLETQWPLPPKDFDPHHHLCAPSDQRLPEIRGGEDVTLVGLTPEGFWHFRLPTVAAPIRLIFDDRVEEAAFRSDTVVIEPDARRLTLKARIAVVTRRNAPALREIVFGHVTPMFLTAARKGKEYTGIGGDGTLPGKATWQP